MSCTCEHVSRSRSRRKQRDEPAGFALQRVGVRLLARRLQAPKSAQSIPLLPRLEAELRTQRERLARRGFQYVAPKALVFSTLTRRSPGRTNALRAITNAAKRAGLSPEGTQPVGVHDLRHSFAAYAFGLGLTPVQVARMMRHANPQVTLTVYAGLASDAVEELGWKLAGMGGAL
jgi:integrase